jgi:uncharacterized protein (TIGR02453 family)
MWLAIIRHVAGRQRYFSSALFDFLRELKAHNNRDWFQKNKSRYERDVRDAALRFIEDVAPRLSKLSPHLLADPRPVGGSLFRINRDIRFSADKSPYKTAVGMSFGHDRGGHDAAPGLYLQLAAGDSFAGGGVHMPETRTLNRIRDAIVRDPAAWKRVVSAPRFAPMVAERGETLKRAPQGYDPDHPFVDDLKRKSYVWHTMFSEREVCAPDFIEAYVDACRTANPFNRFLAAALGVPW